MNKKNIWTWNDNENNLWKFMINKNGDLIYQVMYTDDKWTNENKIDEKVLEFTVSIDDKENIHIIYSKDDELKYCFYDRDKWYGKAIYEFDSSNNDVSELKLIVIEDYINILFLFKNKNNFLVDNIIHYMWSGDKCLESKVCDIDHLSGLDNHYNIEVTEKNEIILFFINYKGNEKKINISIFRDGKWSESKVLYTIKGEKIDFATMILKDGIHLLNFSKDSDVYVIEDVYMNFNEEMIYYKIEESDLEINEVILIEKEGVIWAIWNREDEIVGSFLEEEWKEPFKLCDEKKSELIMYNGLFENINGEKIKAYKLWGIDSNPIKFILPNNSSIKSIEELKENPLTNNNEKKYRKKSVNKELEELRRENKSLEKSLANLQFQLEQRQSFYEKLEDRFINVVNKSKKAEEKCSIFEDAHQESQERLKQANVKLEELNKNLDVISKEKNQFTNMVQEANKEINKLKEDLEQEINKSIIKKIFK